MNTLDVQTILHEMGHKSPSDGELFAILFVCNLGETYGYGNLLGWLNTAWIIEEIKSGIKHEAGIVDNGGHGTTYPIPQLLIDKYKK